jgi:hypothetical protein
MAFHHVVLLRWTEDLTDAAISEFANGLRALPAQIPEIRSYACGARLFDNNWDFAITATFDDEAGWIAYDTHPQHQVVRAIVAGKIADRGATQFVS